MKKTKFGMFKYSTPNLGDNVQSIAAYRFLPKNPDFMIDRDNDLNNFKSDTKVKTIMNGWYMEPPYHWPPTEDIDPLLISMFINQKNSKRAEETFLSKESIEYLKQHGPVGTRDHATRDFLENHGIPAYFSGCMTLTLSRPAELKREDFILAIDVPEKVLNMLKEKTDRPIYTFSVEVDDELGSEAKFFLAKKLLKLYASAHCVITNRLHVALPSTAFETPVLVLKGSFSSPERFKGYEEVLRFMSAEEYCENFEKFDVNNPPANSKEYLKIREGLVKACTEFTGIDKEEEGFSIPTDSQSQAKQYSELYQLLKGKGAKRAEKKKTSKKLKIKLKKLPVIGHIMKSVSATLRKRKRNRR